MIGERSDKIAMQSSFNVKIISGKIQTARRSEQKRMHE